MSPEETAAPGEEGIVTTSTAPAEPAEAPATVETVAPAVVDPNAAPAAPAAPEGEQPDENKGKERLNARFSELTSARRTAEDTAAAATARADAAEAELAKLRPAPAPVVVDPNAAPNPASYDLGEYDPKFIQDSISHGIRTALATVQEQTREERARDEYTTQVSTVRGKLLDSGLPGAALLASGDSSIPCTPFMIQVLGTLEKAPEVANHLATNVAEATRIASLPPHLQGVELARIEAGLAKPVEVSKAPETTRTVAGLAPASDDFTPTMSQTEFEEQVLRKHGGFERRG